MPADRLSEARSSASLQERYAALHEEMVEQYERYEATSGRWALYTFLGWEHLAACAGSYYLASVAQLHTRWPYALLWLVQSGVAVGAVTLARLRTPGDKSPLQQHVNRTWTVFLLLCWSVAILNVMAGQPVFVFLPVLATLSSFAFLVLTSFLSRRFLAAALTMCATGGLIARFPAYGFLIYGVGWLLVLQTVGVVFFRKRTEWLSAAPSAPKVLHRRSQNPAPRRSALDHAPR